MEAGRDHDANRGASVGRQQNAPYEELTDDPFFRACP